MSYRRGEASLRRSEARLAVTSSGAAARRRGCFGCATGAFTSPRHVSFRWFCAMLSRRESSYVDNVISSAGTTIDQRVESCQNGASQLVAIDLNAAVRVAPLSS